MSKHVSGNWGWQNYWKEDRDASCVAKNSDTEKEISEYWQSRFSKLLDGSRILDVATGNGIVLSHAAIAADRVDKRFSLISPDFFSNFPKTIILKDTEEKEFLANEDDLVRSKHFFTEKYFGCDLYK